MQVSDSNKTFLDAFTEVSSIDIDNYGRKKMNVYMMKTNANEFAYEALIEKLLEPMVDFAVSRVTRRKLESTPAHLLLKAREEFRRIEQNKGELGELLIYCFLEAHLHAPKILTKYELKTSSNMYVNGSDGVHFLKLPNNNYQLIFSESKMYKAIGSAISDAFTSIRLFREGVSESGVYKSGIVFEKSLLNSHLEKETFSSEDTRFLERLIYPTKKDGESDLIVDDAFAVFIGYEMQIKDEDKAKPPDIFRKELKSEIEEYVESKRDDISNAIANNGLIGHDIYVYVVPFTDLSNTREKVFEGLLR